MFYEFLFLFIYFLDKYIQIILYYPNEEFLNFFCCLSTSFVCTQATKNMYIYEYTIEKNLIFVYSDIFASYKLFEYNFFYKNSKSIFIEKLNEFFSYIFFTIFSIQCFMKSFLQIFKFTKYAFFIAENIFLCTRVQNFQAFF